eukprot:5563513-Amphidinium_carterae.1
MLARPDIGTLQHQVSHVPTHCLHHTHQVNFPLGNAAGYVNLEAGLRAFQSRKFITCAFPEPGS